ncbi:DUF1833 family protein [Devosia sp. Root635]|uniref:DUF1833 family protein n=1 Tax=Devosia sp. Root635 TaxID=1736575 RepID=UPI0006FD27EB|nr:DUF1833 family protein [Devosia sp. Root635]KRA44702.1 hypothetical protein ASD80_06050 [Devosia sp. Root635]
MVDPWSAALAEAYAVAPADDFVIHTLELLHPAFVDGDDEADSIRVALDGRAWDLELEAGAPLFGGEVKRFEPLSLKVSLPEQSETSFGSLNLSLDNVPRTIWPKLQAAARVRASAQVIYREWVAVKSGSEYETDGPPDMIIDQLTMRVVTATQLRLSGTASFVDLLNRSFPRMTFDMESYPALFGVSE